LCSACERVGWTKPMLIQQKVIPVALEGKDVIGLAETGYIFIIIIFLTHYF
jgi:ATP-dependent RNA helicase DDX47/RRP3